MNAKTPRQKIKEALAGETKTINIGRSRNTSGMGTQTPIEIIEGNTPPRLEGQPYLKTTFSRNGFSKTLYTPSSLRVVVGRGWLA